MENGGNKLTFFRPRFLFFVIVVHSSSSLAARTLKHVSLIEGVRTSMVP